MFRPSNIKELLTIVEERETSLQRIARLKRKRHALILAHNYQRQEVQDVADYRGDSLELSRIAAKSSESVIVF